MSYKRRSAWSTDYSTPSVTRVMVHWSTKSSAYSITFSDTRNWNEMQILIGYIKNIPMHERDVQMDDTGPKKVWIWYLHEKHIIAFNEMVSALSQYFVLDFVAKPSGQTNMAVFIPVDVYLDSFKKHTGYDIKALDHTEAKKLYRSWIRKNHPDVGGDATIASEVNTCWSELERVYFKAKGEICQIA